MERDTTCIDGNQAAAEVAYRLSEVIAIYPITPASPMGEHADDWSAKGRPNLWGDVPQVIEMQSEAGAAGTVHGALTAGALSTTFTASQGLLLMIPNMYKIAGELTPAVIHVAARTIATHALSIFGDHSDVMAARATGFAQLCSSSVQEAHDLALVAHSATLRSRIPFVHFFDGFRTSHEVNKVEVLTEDDLRAVIDEELISAHRARSLDPDRPVLRGSAQNPDTYFQAREGVNNYYAAVPQIVQQTMDDLAARTGRAYNLVDYHGAPDADRVVVMMGSGAGAAREAVDRLNSEGARVGLLTVRLFRPFPTDALLRALPPSVRTIAVLDRTKEPGAPGEPLYMDVVHAIATASPELFGSGAPSVFGGRYGLSSKEFTPAMLAGVFAECTKDDPRNGFTVGIIDDVTHTSLDYDPSFSTEAEGIRAVFYGLGSDGTVGANKSSVKIIGEGTDLHAQGYFVYDSKKSGSVTVSHLRFGPKPIEATYLIDRANFVACHQESLLEKRDLLSVAEPGATFLLNTMHAPEDVWEHLPAHVQNQIVDKKLRFFAINAYKLAREMGLGARINTIMQPCFFALADVLPREEALKHIRASIEKAYGKFGDSVVEGNLAAVDRAVAEMFEVPVPAVASPNGHIDSLVPDSAPDFVKRVTERLMAGQGDLLPVSALPADGTFPTGTAAFEKRGIAQEIPIWDPDICIDCGHCAIVCPHAAIRMKVYDPEALNGAPDTFQTKSFKSAEVEGKNITIQVAPLDCTACGLCVEVCPVKSKTEVKHKAINMQPFEDHVEAETANFDFFLDIPELDRSTMDPGTVKGSQARQPLFEFSGACAGCGETPYLKLLTQLFGDRLLVANATGCSSIYGGNLPTTPWSKNDAGRGPAWSNSLFEDNAEFGLGIRLAADHQGRAARSILEASRTLVGDELVDEILGAPQSNDIEIAAQRDRVAALDELLDALDTPEAERLSAASSHLVNKSVWIVGGDGWAYDIGSAGLDHVLASGQNVNILVLDTEVYSNTGGQASKATPRAAIAKFAAKGKQTRKKDLGLIASQYGDVYVAQIALGANYNQTIKAFMEAEAWPGPSLIIAYSTCIAHGIDMTKSMSHQKEAVQSGYWPLFRYQPGGEEHELPFHLDSKKPTLPLAKFTESEARFAMLRRSAPEEAERLLKLAQEDIDERWRLYEQTAGIERSLPAQDGEE